MPQLLKRHRRGQLENYGNYWKVLTERTFHGVVGNRKGGSKLTVKVFPE